MDPKICINKTYFADSYKAIAEFRQREQTCDISIRTSNKHIMAHKLVLASASQYFQNEIYGLNNSSINELELNEVQYETLLLIVDYMYTGQIKINSENVYEIYKAADCYLMTFVKIMCLEFLIENFNAENCVKVWIMANDCKYERLSTAAAKTILSNLRILSNTSEFLNLSKDELLGLLKLWPNSKLFDSIISATLKWAADKKEGEDTFFNIFKDISATKISKTYLDSLSHNELIQNSANCKKWIANISKEKLKISNALHAEYEAELKLTRFLVDQPIIFMEWSVDGWHNSFKYNLRDGEFNIFNKIEHNESADDCKIYRKWIYAVGRNYCNRFSFDNPNNGYESAFSHNHGSFLKAAVLNESMHIFGGDSSFKTGTTVDLNTKQYTHFSLLHERTCAGIAVNDGSIYICGGYKTNVVEHFDPREGKTTHFGSIPYNEPCHTFAAALPNQIYCSHRQGVKIMDIRNNNIWIDIKEPCKGVKARCLFSSYGRLFTICKDTIYEYNNASSSWNTLNSCQDSKFLWCATSFE